MINKLIVLLLICVYSHPALTAECKFEARELEGVQITELKKGIVQIDLNVPAFVDGMAFYSSQLQQAEPFMFIQIRLPWRKSGKLVGQFFFATEILSDPEIQVFYGSTDCGILLKKKLDISIFKKS